MATRDVCKPKTYGFAHPTEDGAQIATGTPTVDAPGLRAPGREVSERFPRRFSSRGYETQARAAVFSPSPRSGGWRYRTFGTRPSGGFPRGFSHRGVSSRVFPSGTRIKTPSTGNWRHRHFESRGTASCLQVRAPGHAVWHSVTPSRPSGRRARLLRMRGNAAVRLERVQPRVQRATSRQASKTVGLWGFFEAIALTGS